MQIVIEKAKAKKRGNCECQRENMKLTYLGYHREVGWEHHHMRRLQGRTKKIYVGYNILLFKILSKEITKTRDILVFYSVRCKHLSAFIYEYITCPYKTLDE